jgi:hypothetical protein
MIRWNIRTADSLTGAVKVAVAGAGVLVIGLLVFGLVAGVPGRAHTAGKSVAAPASADVVKLQIDLHEVATVSVQRTVDKLGADGGFYRTPRFHIPLPPQAAAAVKTLTVNYSTPLPVALDRAINRAAEKSVHAAGDYMLASLPGLTFRNPPRTLRGPADAVTNAVRNQTEAAFRDAMLPVVRANLAAEDAQAALDNMRVRYEAVAHASFPSVDLESYAVDSFIAAFYSGMAQEEQDIRTLSSARTTETLKQMFSGR